MALELISLAIEIAVRIKDAADNVDANRGQAKELERRVDAISRALGSLSKDPKREYVPALKELTTVLGECEDFIRSYQKTKKRWLIEFLGSGTNKEKFEELSLRLQNACSGLNLALTVFNIAALQDAEKEDAAAIEIMFKKLEKAMESNNKDVVRRLKDMKDDGQRNKGEILGALQAQYSHVLQEFSAQQNDNEEIKAQLVMQGMLVQQILQGQQQLHSQQQAAQRAAALLVPHADAPRPVSPGPTGLAAEADRIGEALLAKLQDMMKVMQGVDVHERRDAAHYAPRRLNEREKARHEAKDRLRRRHRIDPACVQIHGPVRADDSVFVASQGSYLGNEVLVKRLRFGDENTERIFFKEVAALSRIQSPNVLHFYGASFEEGNLFLVHEPIHHLLQQVLEGAETHPTSLQALEWLEEIASGISYLHTKGIVHGALSPSCVAIVGPEKQAKLTGFGFSEAVPAAPQPSSESHATMAALDPVPCALSNRQFLAPELFDRPPASRSMLTDMFSFGLLLWVVACKQQLPSTFSVSHFSRWEKTLLDALPACYHSIFSNCTSAPSDVRCTAQDALSELSLLLSKKREAEAERLYQKGKDLESQLQAPLKAAEGHASLLSEVDKERLASAKSYYARAVHMGHVKAKSSLGYFYGKGWACSQVDYKRAFKLHYAGATHPRMPHARAMYNVAVHYHRGRGVDLDKKQALEWYKLADKSGYSLSQKDLPETIKSLARELHEGAKGLHE